MRRLCSRLLIAGAIAALVAAVLVRPRFGHPVTPFMREAAAAATGRVVPRFHERARDRPLVVVFIRPDCPCSEAYEPYTHELFRAYQSRADFLGVVAGEVQEAESWRQKHGTPFGVVADVDRSLARGYAAERSAYTALLLDGETVHHLWPGYSAGMLQDLGKRLAAATGTPEASLPLAGAPETLTSGCLLEP